MANIRLAYSVVYHYNTMIIQNKYSVLQSLLPLLGNSSLYITCRNCTLTIVNQSTEAITISWNKLLF